MANPIIGAVGLGSSILGGIMGARGASESAQAQSQQYMYQAGLAQFNAQIAEQNATYSLKQGEKEAAKYGLGARQQAGQIRAAQGASGLDVGSGSAKEVQESQHLVSTMDMNQIRENAAKVAYNYRTQAEEFRSQAAADMLGAYQAKRAGRTNVAASIIGAAGSVASKWLQGQQYGMWGV